MSMRSDWVAIKARAKSLNNGKEVKFKKDLGLGKVLDKFEAADKVRDKKSSEMNASWAKAVDDWGAAAKEVNRIANVYRTELEHLVANDVAKNAIEIQISMRIFRQTGDALAEAKRLEPILKKHRKK